MVGQTFDTPSTPSARLDEPQFILVDIAAGHAAVDVKAIRCFGPGNARVVKEARCVATAEKVPGGGLRLRDDWLN